MELKEPRNYILYIQIYTKIMCVFPNKIYELYETFIVRTFIVRTFIVRTLSLTSESYQLRTNRCNCGMFLQNSFLLLVI